MRSSRDVIAHPRWLHVRAHEPEQAGLDARAKARWLRNRLLFLCGLVHTIPLDELHARTANVDLPWLRQEVARAEGHLAAYQQRVRARRATPPAPRGNRGLTRTSRKRSRERRATRRQRSSSRAGPDGDDPDPARAGLRDVDLLAATRRAQT
jgi:hypothetical protein